MDFLTITTTSLVSAIEKALANDATDDEMDMVEHALQDEDWVLFVQDHFRPDDFERRYCAASSFGGLGQRLQHTLRAQPKLPEWKVPGFFAVYAYNQIFGWSGYLPASQDSREMLLKVYSDVASAFARIDDNADFTTGAIKRPPSRIEAASPADDLSIAHVVRVLRQILRLHAMGAMADRLLTHAKFLQAPEFQEATRAAERGFLAVKADIVRQFKPPTNKRKPLGELDGNERKRQETMGGILEKRT